MGRVIQPSLLGHVGLVARGLHNLFNVHVYMYGHAVKIGYNIPLIAADSLVVGELTADKLLPISIT